MCNVETMPDAYGEHKLCKATHVQTQRFMEINVLALELLLGQTGPDEA